MSHACLFACVSWYTGPSIESRAYSCRMHQLRDIGEKCLTVGSVKALFQSIDNHTTLFQKRYNPTTNDNFNNSCPIPTSFGTNIAE